MKLPEKKPDGGKQLPGRFLYLMVLASLVLVITPSFLNAVSEVRQTHQIGGYENSVKDTGRDEADRLRKKAVQYNRRIFRRQQKALAHYTGSGEKDREYMNLLNPDGEGTMAFIEIPSQKIYLPIGHGTSAALLRKSAGHMYGTSLPIGSRSANAVITAHSGLASAKLFSDLDKVEEGDTFRVHVCGEIHIYRVASVDVVLPEEETPFLQAEPGKDIVTLYTCTPKGVNDHRLIVRGYRSGTRKEDGDAAEKSFQSRNLLALLKAAALAGIPAGYTVLWAVLRKRRQERVNGGLECVMTVYASGSSRKRLFTGGKRQ